MSIPIGDDRSAVGEPVGVRGALSSWLNGAKAEVFLVEDGAGARSIKKRYRRGSGLTMLRELIALSYLSNLDILPRVIDVDLFHREIVLSYLPGERVLEWVLKRYGSPGLDVDRFRSFHGLETDQEVCLAFQNFRDSTDAQSRGLKEAIRASYSQLHRKKVVHGDPSPRNLIFDGTTVYLLDFDHARPSVDPSSVDFVAINRWYGLPRMD